MAASSEHRPTDNDPAALRAEIVEKTALVQDIRRDLIQAQISILELNDVILQKETDKADAVSILGQLEHALEEKVNHIVELDRVLNGTIAELRAQLAGETAQRDRVIADLVQRLDAANREIGKTHELAAGYARDLSETRERLVRTLADLDGVKNELAATDERLRNTEAARVAVVREVNAMRRRWTWRLTKPFRALRDLLP